MNEQEAFALMERVNREINAAHAIINQEPDEWYSSDLPHDGNVYVVTQDGETYGVMWFSGEYSAYGEKVADSPEVWDRASSDWKQVLFNPDGEWKHRTVLSITPRDKNLSVFTIALDCAHETLWINHLGHTRPSVGDDYACNLCRMDGIGLTDAIVESAVSKTLDKEQ